MGGSANDSSRTSFLPPRPLFLSATHAPPIATVTVSWDRDMDQTVTPALTSMEVTIDGVPENPTIITWLSALDLQLTISGPAATSMTVKLLVQDTNLRSLVGSFALAPQSIVAFP